MEVVDKETIQAMPSYPPACEVSEVAASDYIYNVRKAALEVCIPAIVVEYERDKNIVKVTPAVNEKTSTDKYIKRAEVKVPVFSFAGGGFMMNFPLKKGDTGWLLSCDRDISLFKQQLTAINPNTERSHCIEDSFFFPDKVNKFNLDKEDKDNFVLQSLTRNLKLSFSGDTIKIYAGPGAKDEKKSQENEKNETYITLKKGEVSIITTDNLIAQSKNANITTKENLTATVKKDCTVIAEGNVNMKAPNIKIEGEVAITGNVSISGNTDVGGNVTASDCIGGGKSLASHIHQGVHGPTGGPQ